MTTPPKPDLCDLTREELRAFVVGLGAPAFRGDQVFRWLWKRGAALLPAPFDAMTDLPAGFRAQLAAAATIGRVEAARI